MPQARLTHPTPAGSIPAELQLEHKNMKITTKRLAPCAAQVLVDGVPAGRYGGRLNQKWAQLEDGTMLVDDSRLCVKTIKGIIVSAYRKSITQP